MWRPVRLLSTLLAVVSTGVACGGKANSDGSEPREPSEPGALPSTPPVQVPARPEAPPTPTILPGDGDPLPPETDPADRDPATDETATVSGVIYEILERNCGACHTPVDSTLPRARLAFTDDIDLMVELGFIIPLESGRSPLVQLILTGVMPPPGVEPRPSDYDILTLQQFIDNPNFWPIFTSGPTLDAGTNEPAVDAGPGDTATDAGN